MGRQRGHQRGRTGEAWRSPADPPPQGKRILIRFFIREGRENVEYVLAGEYRERKWIVKAPWDPRGLNVKPCVLAENWAPMPQEPLRRAGLAARVPPRLSPSRGGRALRPATGANA